MQATAEVVIIGAGIIGCSTAYHLARMGITDVAVVEMGEAGSGSSSKSASMLSLQFCDDELGARMAQYSYARYMRFEEEMGVPIDFKRTGWLSLATAEVAERLRQGAQMLQSLGITTEVWVPEEIGQRYPEINTADIVLGTWGPDDGPFDPHTILWGYIRRARALGVQLYQGVRATGVAVRGGQVEGVRTEQGLISCHVAVNAAGAWAGEVGRWVGVEIPVTPLARCIWVTRPFPDIPSDRPFVEDVAVEWYCRPEGPGILIGMGKVPTEQFDIHLEHSLLGEMIERAVHRIPVLEKAAVQTSWTGIRPISRDGHPILGPVPAVAGFILNCGWGGTGIIQSPIAGQLVAEYIANGRTTTLEIEPFRIDRFSVPGER